MTPALPPDAARRAVWIAFADHFLDTETRQELPWAALAAVEAGHSVEQARGIWSVEVRPVGRILEAVEGRRRPRCTASYLAHRIGRRFHDASWAPSRRS